MRNIIWIENMLIKHPEFHIPGKEVFIKMIRIFLLLMQQKLQLKELKKTEKVLFWKEKNHTIKTQVIINSETKQIISTAFSTGKIHDFKLFKDSKTYVNHNSYIIANSGYQRLEKIHKKTLIPFKKSKNKPLIKLKKKYNNLINTIRIKMELMFFDD